MSPMEPEYILVAKLTFEKHVQIIDLTRNGTAPESRPLPSRKSC
jgi:hypothetical protein